MGVMPYHGEVWIPDLPVCPEMLEATVHSTLWTFYAGNPDNTQPLWQEAKLGGLWSGSHDPDRRGARTPEYNVPGMDPIDIIPVKDLIPCFWASVFFFRKEVYASVWWDGGDVRLGPLYEASMNDLLKELGISEGYLVTLECRL